MSSTNRFLIFCVVSMLSSIVACVPYKSRQFPNGMPQEQLVTPLENHTPYKVCFEPSLASEKTGVVVAIYRNQNNQSLLMKAYQGRGKYTSIRQDKKLIVLEKTPLYDSVVTEIKSSQDASLFVQGENVLGTYYAAGNFLTIPKNDKVDFILDCQ